MDPTASPPANRLSRPPNVPGIFEEDEEDEVFDEDREPSPTIRRRSRGRLSASRLPLPARMASPPLPISGLPSVVAEKPKKKTSRRQSGLLAVETIRPPSPAIGSPIQKLTQEAQEEEDAEMEIEVTAEILSERKGESGPMETGSDDSDGLARARERKRRRDEEEISSVATSPPAGVKTLKDVTNSPRGRASLPPLDTNTTGNCSISQSKYVAQPL